MTPLESSHLFGIKGRPVGTATKKFIASLAAGTDPSVNLTDWYNYMAAYLKSVDPNHMVREPLNDSKHSRHATNNLHIQLTESS